MANVSEATPRGTTLERVYDGPVEDLWELWTTKEGLEEWFAPEGCRIEVIALDVRSGGAFDHVMTAVEKEPIAYLASVGRPPTTRVRARFVEVRPLERLHIRFTVDFAPGLDTHPMDLVAEFRPEGERVRMVVSTGVHPDAEFTRAAGEGLASQMRRFDLAMASRPRPRRMGSA